MTDVYGMGSKFIYSLKYCFIILQYLNFHKTYLHEGHDIVLLSVKNREGFCDFCLGSRYEFSYFLFIRRVKGEKIESSLLHTTKGVMDVLHSPWHRMPRVYCLPQMIASLV